MIWLMLSDRPDAVPLTSDPAHQAHMPEVIGFLLKSLFQAREHVVAGGPMPYGVSLSDLFRMGALYTDKILRSIKPADSAHCATGGIRIRSQPQNCKSHRP